MKSYYIKRIFILVLVVTALLNAETLTAQIKGGLPSSAKVNDMSDQQIMQLWQQAQRSGLSETDAMSLLVKRGLPSSEVTAFKRRLVTMQSRSKSGAAQNLIADSARFMKDSSWVTEIPAIRKKSNYFGFDFFNNPEPSFEPNLRLTTPKNYVLGPDDDLTISFTGVNESSTDATVSADGTISIPYAGIININGLTIDQATQKIKGRMTQAYPALATGKTQVFLTLNNFRLIDVTVIGEAERPGIYHVSALASMFNLLYRAGGPSENGSLRKIELIRNNKVVETVDFYAFLQKGLFGKDIRLQDQDIIRFPLYNKRVAISGEIRRPAIYELLEKETLAELIQMAGGMESGAITDVAKVVQMGSREMNVRDVVANDFNYFIPRNGDSVFIDKISSRFANRVVLSGAVYRPGNYELNGKLSLSALIKKADGLREDAFNRGYIKRTTTDFERELISFSAKDILNGNQPDILLMREDSVMIPSRDSLRDAPRITVGGNVRAPGVFEFREGMSVEDAILMAGGFTNDAANHKVEISRMDKNKADTMVNKVVDLITLNIDSSLHSGSAKTLLQPLDYIFVPRLLNYRYLGTVKLRGEVLYAGDYALEKRNETVQELIARSGGLSAVASLADAQVYRKGLRVATDLLGTGSESAQKFLLLPDDSIYIPRKDPFVEVQGFVFNPQIFNFESNNFKSYISKAGGVTDKGNLKKAYIQYSNGINQKIRHFLFFRIYPKVLPGSKIIVPEKVDIPGKGISPVEISALIGALSALVSLIAVLKN